MYVYFDESGDLGFSFDESGDLDFSNESSKFLTICFTIVKDKNKFKRCVRKTKEEFNIPSDVELKGRVANLSVRKYLLEKLINLEDLEIYAITVKKKNVKERLRSIPNLIYNYMVGLSLVERIVKEEKNASFDVLYDRRVLSVKGVLNLEEYIKYKVWLEKGRDDIKLDIRPADSHNSLAIQGIHIIANIVFRKYEDGNFRLFNVIKNKVIEDKKLFFNK